MRSTFCRNNVLGAIVLVTITAHADHIRVSTAAQLASASTSARPGDTLTMTNGTWTNAQLVFQASGDSLRPIVLSAETPGQVIITGASNLRIAGRWLVVDGLRFESGTSPSGAVVEFRAPSGTESSRCRLTNTSVVDYNPTDNMVDYKWVSLYGAYNRVDHCYLAGKSHSGTTLVVWLGPSPNYHQIDSNYFGPRPVLGVNGGETIRVGTSDWSMYDSYTVVENNYFYKCDGEAEIISSKSGENIYRGNTFVSCGGALTLRHGNRCLVEGNFFLGNNVSNSGGVRVIGEDHIVINNYMANLAGSSMKSALPIMNGVPNSPLNRYFQVKRSVVAFNTIVDCKYNVLVGVGKDPELTLPPIDCVIANNVVRSTSGPLIQYVDTPVNITYEGNVFHGAALGITQPAGISMVDPLLAKDATGLWRPTSGSPLIDAAVGTYSRVATDMDGQPRTGAKDVGADEVVAGTPERKPLAPDDVGPAWMRIPTSVDEGISIHPEAPVLEPNYPNPFNSATAIRFKIVSAGNAKVTVFDVAGREVAVLVDANLSPGPHSVHWRASGVSSGTYSVVLKTSGGTTSRRVTLLK